MLRFSGFIDPTSGGTVLQSASARLAICLALAANVGHLQSAIVAPGASIAFQIGTPLTLYEPALGQLVFRNQTDDILLTDLGANELGALHFELRRPNGLTQKAEPGALPASGGIIFPGRVEVAPNETFLKSVLLNQWFDFSDVGRYQLRVRFSGEVKRPSGTFVEVDRDVTIDIDVRGADERRLRDACEALLGRIKNSKKSEEGLTAARALASIKRPLAVRYLHEAIRADRLVDSIAITGLESIGNDAAVRALEEELGNRHAETAAAANAALNRLQRQIR
jgi:hypothetical protein